MGSFGRINYGGSEEIFKTEVTDGSGKILDRWKCMKKDFPNALRILNRKYGLNLVIKERKIIKEENKDKDLDWAM